MAEIQIQWGKAPKKMGKKYKAARKTLLSETGFFWWNRLFPKRFHESNRIEYGIRKRSKKYIERKRKKGFGVDPLVYTGALKELATSRMPKQTVNAKGLKMPFRGLPRYIGLSRVRIDGKDGDERNELQKRIQDEFQNSIYIAQRKLADEGKKYTLKHLLAASQGLLSSNKKTHNLPPMANELIAVSFADEKQLRNKAQKVGETELNKPDK